MSRVRLLKKEPYNQKEAEAAIGLRTDNGQRPSFDQATAIESAPSPRPDMEVEQQGDAR